MACFASDSSTPIRIVPTDRYRSQNSERSSNYSAKECDGRSFGFWRGCRNTAVLSFPRGIHLRIDSTLEDSSGCPPSTTPLRDAFAAVHVLLLHSGQHVKLLTAVHDLRLSALSINQCLGFPLRLRARVYSSSYASNRKIKRIHCLPRLTSCCM